MLTIDTTNMCSHLQRKLFEEDGIYHHLWIAMRNDPELTAVVLVAVSSSNGSRSGCSFPCTSLQALNRASSESRAELVRTMPSRERGRAELNHRGA